MGRLTHSFHAAAMPCVPARGKERGAALQEGCLEALLGPTDGWMVERARWAALHRDCMTSSGCVVSGAAAHREQHAPARVRFASERPAAGAFGGGKHLPDSPKPLSLSLSLPIREDGFSQQAVCISTEK
ncbi:hypothetical protein Vafri_4206, partial [Volvox africanus]